MEGFMKFFIFILFFFIVSCDSADLKKDFSEYACKVYVECEFSAVKNYFCLEFAGYAFDLIPEGKKVECVECLKDLRCDMWFNADPCFNLCN